MSGSHHFTSPKPNQSQSNAGSDPSLHAHKKGDAKHSHSKEVSNQNLLLIALILTLSFSGVEGAAAYFAGSLALISDAGHMVTDAAAWIKTVSRPINFNWAWNCAANTLCLLKVHVVT